MNHKTFIAILFLNSFCIVSMAQSASEGIELPTRQATFNGGSEAWVRYLTKNLHANTAKKAQAPPGKYKVEVEFVVDTAGNINNVQATSVPPLCKPCGEEAVRILQSSPRWIPALKNGKAVSLKKKQSITFQNLADERIQRNIPLGPILIKFENLSLRDAIKKATVTGKIVYAQFISDKCENCNEVAEMAMKSQSLASVVNEKCIPIKIDLNYHDRKEFIETYNPNEYVGTYFISGDEDLLSRFPKTTSRAADYIAEVNKAIAKQMEGHVTMKELNEEWNSNPGNITAMEMNLQKRFELGWKTDSLLEIFVSRLPTDSVKSKRELGFIANQAPSLFSQANYVLRKDLAAFNNMWYQMPLPTRISINRRIIYKSLHKAIDLKNETMAATVASFTEKTHEPNEPKINGQRHFEKQWLDYYIGIRDTAAFIPRAMQYYDRFFMTVNVKDVLLRDSINLRRSFDTAVAVMREDPNVKGRFIATRSSSFIPYAGYFAMELIRGAWLLYTSTNNTAHLQKALSWTMRAKEFNRYGDLQNTYGRLQYVAGNKQEAISSQKEIIIRLKLINRNTKKQEDNLAKMEANEKL